MTGYWYKLHVISLIKAYTTQKCSVKGLPMLISTPVITYSFADFLVWCSHWSLQEDKNLPQRQFCQLLSAPRHSRCVGQDADYSSMNNLGFKHLPCAMRSERSQECMEENFLFNGQCVCTLSEIKIQKDFSQGKECFLSLLHFEKWGSLASKKSRGTSVVPIIFFAPTGMTASHRPSPTEQ